MLKDAKKELEVDEWYFLLFIQLDRFKDTFKKIDIIQFFFARFTKVMVIPREMIGHKTGVKSALYVEKLLYFIVFYVSGIAYAQPLAPHLSL